MESQQIKKAHKPFSQYSPKKPFLHTHSNERSLWLVTQLPPLWHGEEKHGDYQKKKDKTYTYHTHHLNRYNTRVTSSPLRAEMFSDKELKFIEIKLHCIIIVCWKKPYHNGNVM